MQDRRTMGFIRHMRRSAFFLGRPGGLITEITWKAGDTISHDLSSVHTHIMQKRQRLLTINDN